MPTTRSRVSFVRGFTLIDQHASPFLCVAHRSVIRNLTEWIVTHDCSEVVESLSASGEQQIPYVRLPHPRTGMWVYGRFGRS